MCSGPQVVHGKLAANLAAAANWPHLSSLGWMFFPCSFPSAPPGSITAWGEAEPARTTCSLWFMALPPPRPVPSVPLPELPRKQQDMAQQIPKSWMILAGLLGEKKYHSSPQHDFFFLLLFELTENIG